MHNHTITYTNFNGDTKTRTLNFNLTEAELTKLQKDYLHLGGINAVMDEAIQSGDTKQLLDFFELLVHRSYGIKSADGEEFEKSPELMRRFENQAFYSDLYMSFFQDGGEVGQAFIRAVMPADLIAKAEANVRGEGELQAAADAATAFKPDARTLAQQARENLKDHLPKVQERNANIQTATESARPTQNIFEQAQPATPQPIVVQETPVSPLQHSEPVAEQPSAPQPTPPSEWRPSAPVPTQSPADFRVPAEAPVEETPVMTREQWLAQESSAQLPRPIHEQAANGL